MYDDLSSLTAKLKMSGVSFHEMNEEKGVIMPAVSPLATALEFTADAPETLVNNVQPISRQESAGVSAPAAAPARAKSRPAPAPNAFASLAGGIMESVAAMTRTPEQDVFERNPVRLDMLFTTIGK